MLCVLAICTTIRGQSSYVRVLGYNERPPGDIPFFLLLILRIAADAREANEWGAIHDKKKESGEAQYSSAHTYFVLLSFLFVSLQMSII